VVLIQYESMDGYKNIVMSTIWTPSPLSDDQPKYLALADAIDAAIRDGALAPGAKLPPVRDLAWEMKVTPGTIARAYRIGVDRGALEATVGRGTFVRSAAPRSEGLMALTSPVRRPSQFDMRGNWPPAVGQDAIITAALRRMLDRDGPLPLTEYHRHGEDLRQREAAAAWLQSGGLPADADRVVMCPGALQGVLTALLAVARQPNPVILMEELGFIGLRDGAETVGLKVAPVAMDAEGVIPEAVEAACIRHRPSAILLSSAHQNPTLATMSAGRLDAIAAVARKHGLAIVEDDVYGWLQPERGPCFVDVAPERTWYLTSFSKCVAAGMRTGFLLCPEGAGQDAARVLVRLSHHLPYLVTMLAAELIESGDAAAIRARVAAEIAARETTFRQAFATHAPNANIRSDPAVGFVWLTLPSEWRAPEFAAACAAENVLVADGDGFAISGVAPYAGVRVALGGAAPTTGDIAACGATIARILARGPAPSAIT